MVSAENGGAVHSFVVPAFGESPYLAACLDSLTAQTRLSPVIVTTPCPYPGLQSLVERCGARLVVNPDGGGIGRDWNFALSQATTPWVTIAHQDDIYLPRFVEATLDLVRAAPRTSLAFTGYGELQAGRARTGTVVLFVKRMLLELGFLGRRSVSAPGAKRRLLRFGCPIPCPTVTVRRDLGLRFREDLKVNLDWEAWLRLAGSAGSFVYSRECLVLHRIHRDSETSAGIQGGVRAMEDMMLFQALWPRPVARLLARAYALSYQGAGE